MADEFVEENANSAETTATTVTTATTEPAGGAGVKAPTKAAAASGKKVRELSMTEKAVKERERMAAAIAALTPKIGRQAIAADVNMYKKMRSGGINEAEVIAMLKALVRTAKLSEANSAARASRNKNASRKITKEVLNKAVAERLRKRVTRRRAYEAARATMSPRTAAAKVLANIPSLEKSEVGKRIAEQRVAENELKTVVKASLQKITEGKVNDADVAQMARLRAVGYHISAKQYKLLKTASRTKVGIEGTAGASAIRDALVAEAKDMDACGRCELTKIFHIPMM